MTSSLLAETQLLRQRLADGPSCGPLIEAIVHRKRVIPPSRSSHVRGWHPVRKNHPAVPFESLLECRVISALAGYQEFLGILSQPLTVSYWYRSRLHRYTPDFWVSFNEVPPDLEAIGFARETYLEVKPLLRALSNEDDLHRRLSCLQVAT